jgi:hypothetical protein
MLVSRFQPWRPVVRLPWPSGTSIAADLTPVFSAELYRFSGRVDNFSARQIFRISLINHLLGLFRKPANWVTHTAMAAEQTARRRIEFILEGQEF